MQTKPTITQDTPFKAHQLKVKDVLECILEATKEGENFYVAIGTNGFLTISKDVLINGLATNNKKLIINFMKDSIISKHIVLGQTTSTHYILQPHQKMPLEDLTKEILSQIKSLQDVPICYGIFEEQWVTACEQYNLKNKYSNWSEEELFC